MFSANKTGLAVGLALGGWHALWSALVATGAAQAVLDFVFWLHFIKPVYVVEPFAVGRAIALIGGVTALGYAVGVAFAVLWNRLHRGPQ